MARARRQVIGRGRSLTEAEIEQGDDDLIEPADGDEHFQTPRVEDVLQAETGLPDEPIPVRLVNPVNVNQLPTSLANMFSRSIAASPAKSVKILAADPRRAAVTIPAAVVVVAIGRTQAEADDANAFQLEVNQGPYRFHFTEELWVRSTAGATRISVAVEQWAR